MSHQLELSRLIEVTPEVAFSFWTEPTHIGSWFCYDGTWQCEVAEVDLRVDGHYHLAMRSPDGELFSVRGQYLQIERPTLLRYSWLVDHESANDTIVTVYFEHEAEGTRVRVVHEQFADATLAESHLGGWQLTLQQFDRCTNQR